MLPAKRKELIQTILLERQNITTKELMTILQTSRTTLYRDLLLLQKENFLQVNNGTVSLQFQSSPHSFCPDNLRRATPSNLPQLRAIATTAASIINATDSIFIVEGMVCHLLACQIRELDYLKNITVVTNNFNVALELNGFIKHIYLIGGELHQNPNSLYTGGPRLEENLRTIYVSKAFANVDGVDLKAGYTMQELSQLGILSHLSAFSAESVFLIPSNRFGYCSVHHLAALDQADRIITDNQLSQKNRDTFLALQRPELVIAE